MSKLGFDKFINKKSAAKVKEEHRQEKRKSKAALRAAGDEFRKQKLEKQRGGNIAPREDENFRGGKSFRERGAEAGRGTQRTPQRGADGRFTKAGDRNDRRHNNNGDHSSRGSDNRNSRPSGSGNNSKGYDRGRKAGQETDRSFSRGSRSYDNDNDRDRNDQRRPENSRFKQSQGKYTDKPSRHAASGSADDDSRSSRKKGAGAEHDTMPLNKYIAHAGVCGRREAAELVKLGQVQVNGDTVFEPAIKISEKDTVKLKGKKLTLQVKHFYFLLNKPKDHITTTKDEKGRKTVLDLFEDMDIKHLYPVGRLDRNTTGVLLITNDGELAQQLTHPSFEVKKIYEATLDRPVAKKDLEAIATGITLEDGDIKADQVGYPDAKNKAIVGIEIHSGKNRIVRRIFEHLGYEVKKLDRVMFAGLTKKNVERGKWRYLSEKEIRILKYMNAGGTKKSQKVAALQEAEMTADNGQAEPAVKKAKRVRIPLSKEAAGKTAATAKRHRPDMHRKNADGAAAGAGPGAKKERSTAANSRGSSSKGLRTAKTPRKEKH